MGGMKSVALQAVTHNVGVHHDAGVLTASPVLPRKFP